MADYIAHARSNYFEVKDRPAFEAWCEALGFEVIGGNANTAHLHPNMVGFLVNSDHGTIPTSRYDDDADVDVDIDIDIFADLADMLVDGHVAIVMEVGNEKMSYVGGWAQAVNSKGEERSINLDSITTLAKELGEHVTDPAY